MSQDQSHSESLPTGLAGRINPLCDRFEAAWRAGERPRLEDYLPQVEAADQAGLLRELLALELHYRGRLGERPAVTEYRQRFPAHGDLIDGSFSTAGPETLSTPQSGRADDAAPPPSAFPGYELLGELGRGGMGVVYKARQLGFNRIVAVKMILSGSYAGDDERERFRIETQAVARLQHPNIVQVHEVGEHESKPFFSMEFCPGGGLDKKLNGTPLPPAEAARLVETLAWAVQTAHEKGVVHRDLKPANVLLGEDSTPKVTDFGLAKRMDAEGRTATGAVMGTPSYMAPEQAGGKTRDIGPATDVYALGAILYECLTGRPPFKGPTTLDTLAQVLADDPVPPRQLQSKTPRDLETICLKCLEKQPARRYATAAELADDLGRWQRGEPVRAQPVGRLERAVKWARRRPALAALVGVIVLALVALAVLSANLAVARSDADEKRKDAEQQKGIAEARRKDAEQQKGIALGREEEAKDEADKAERASDYLVSIFELADPNGPRGTMTARQILDDAEKTIPQQFADQPELREKLLQKIGTVEDRLTAASPLAMILEASGTVQLQSTRNPNQRAVPQTLLYTGDRLTLAADAQVQLVVLSNLHKERLRPGTEATVRRKGCEPADAVAVRDPDILMTFVRLPKGTFYMGWLLDEQGFLHKGVKTEIKGVKTEIKDDFEIAVHDVTQGQWQAVMGENPSYFSRFAGGRNDVKNISDEELKLFPVEKVSWDEAQEFIKRLNQKERGRGYLYRLPTEAEWEYACRGGATSEEECSYNFYIDKPTNDLSMGQANFDFISGSEGQPEGKFLARPSRVGAYPPNKLGLYDMHGNVGQWCAHDEPEGRRDSRDSTARGGSYVGQAILCCAASRFYRFVRGDRQANLGFRLARVPVR